MATPAIENLINFFKDEVEITLIGSFVQLSF
jgi:hypothetical protein